MVHHCRASRTLHARMGLSLLLRGRGIRSFRCPTSRAVLTWMLQSCWMHMDWKPVLQTVLLDYQQCPSLSIAFEEQSHLHAGSLLWRSCGSRSSFP